MTIWMSMWKSVLIANTNCLYLSNLFVNIKNYMWR